MERVLKLRYTPTFVDQYVALLDLIPRVPVQLIISLLFPIAGVAVLVVAIQREGIPSVLDLVLAVGCIGFTQILMLGLVAMGRFRNRLADLSQTIVFDDDGISFDAATFSTSLKWAALRKAVETRHNLFLFVSPMAAVGVPKSAFSEPGSLDTARAMIRERLVDRARLLQ
jgi:hypothetical protein